MIAIAPRPAAVLLVGRRASILRLSPTIHLQKSSQAMFYRIDDWRDSQMSSASTSGFNLPHQIRPMSAIPTQNCNNTADRTNTTPNKLTTHQQAKQLFSKYGAVFIGTYLGVYVTTLVSLFGALEYGVLDVEMLSTLREAVPLPHVGLHIGVSDGFFDGVSDKLYDFVNQIVSTEKVDEMKQHVKDNPHLSNLAIAWIAVKFTEPLRLAASVVLCPKISSMLGRNDELRPTV